MNLNKYYMHKNDYGITPIREQKLLNLIGNQVSRKTVLDLGCATGYLGQKLQKMGARVIGIDISSQAIKRAKKVLTDAIVFDLNSGELPFKRSTFDIIIASEVIEHLFQPVNVLKDLHRLLKSDGKLILSTPNFLYWGNRLKFLMGQFRYTQSGMFDEGHIHFYTYETLMEDLKKSRLKILKEEHLYQGTEILHKIKKYFPGVFAYQFVVESSK